MNPIVKLFDLAAPRVTGQLNDASPIVGSDSDATTGTVPMIMFVERSTNDTCALRIAPEYESRAGSPSTAVMSFTVTVSGTVAFAPSVNAVGPVYITRASSA